MPPTAAVMEKSDVSGHLLQIHSFNRMAILISRPMEIMSAAAKHAYPGGYEVRRGKPTDVQ